MSQPRDLPHPRKLYSALREAPSPQARARAAADFLCSCANAEAIHFFLARGAELVLAVSSPNETASPGLLAEATRAWSRDLEGQPEHSKTKTIDVSALDATSALEESALWKSETGSYERRVLGTYRESHWVPIGLAMLKCRPDRDLSPIRQAHVESICNAFVDAGDVPLSTDPRRPG
jgi:hypothetical protein